MALDGKRNIQVKIDFQLDASWRRLIPYVDAETAAWIDQHAELDHADVAQRFTRALCEPAIVLDDPTPPAHLTTAIVDLVLEQLGYDRANASYWFERGDQLDAAQTWLESLRDWLAACPTPTPPGGQRWVTPGPDANSPWANPTKED